jgi:CheY-like chemotaxis protein
LITTEALNGHSCRVLVVEDEALIAMLVEDMIHDSGGEMVGPAAKLSDAVDLARKAQAVEGGAKSGHLAATDQGPQTLILG